MKILHLYHDIMNLYGEYANLSALTRMLEHNNISYELNRASVKDVLSLMEYDFVYVGSGTESGLRQVMEHFRQYTEDVKSYIDAGKLLLMTGNSFEMLGTQLSDAKGNSQDGLGLFSFTTKEQERVRTTADAVFTMENHDKPLVGFINKCSTIDGIETPLFQVKMGLGNEKNGSTEGIREKNFFGTHLTGPLLIKNPYFLEYITEILLHNCAMEQPVDGSWMIYEKQGYEVTLRELNKRITGER